MWATKPTTVRGYLSGDREPCVRRRPGPDPFDRFEPYVRQRLADGQHVWATTLYNEVAALGYERSYQTFTRLLVRRQERNARGRDTSSRLC